jgi:hypothetical protein
MSEQIPSRACVEQALAVADRLHELASRALRIEGNRPYLGMIRSERIELNAIFEAQRVNFRVWQSELGSYVNWYTQGWPPEVVKYLQELAFIEFNVTCRVNPIVYDAADDPDWRPSEYDMTQDEFALLDQARTHLRAALYPSDLLSLDGRPVTPVRGINANEIRDQYIYEEEMKGIPRLKIKAVVNDTTGWGRIKTTNGIKNRAISYAKKHNLTPIPARKQPANPRKNR